MKVPFAVKRLLHAYKGRLISTRKTRVSDADAILELLRHTDSGNSTTAASKSVFELAGFIKGGKPYDSVKEIDKVVYGT